jgi:glycosyltransferase involved in cell wall biosynthesis
LLVAPGDVDALAKTMSHLASNRERARRMGEQARRDFLDRYTIDRFRQRVGGFYRRALEA